MQIFGYVCQRIAACDSGGIQSLSIPNITKISVSEYISDKTKTSHYHKLLLAAGLYLFSTNTINSLMKSSILSLTINFPSDAVINSISFNTSKKL